MTLADDSGLAAEWARRLQLKADCVAAGHRQALRHRVNRCWDLLQQQQQSGVAQLLEVKAAERGGPEK